MSTCRRFLSQSVEREVGLPKKNQLRRRATFWFTRGLHCSILHCTGAGLETFASSNTPGVQEGDVPLFKPGGMPRTLFLSNDEHSVGLAAGYFMRRYMHMHQVTISDESHRINNDIWGGVRAQGQWFTMMCLRSVDFNVNYGPWQGNAFWRQIQGAMAKHRDGFSPSECIIFQRLLPLMARDQGVSAIDMGSSEFVQQQWVAVHEGPATQSLGPKMNFTRWGSWFDCRSYWDPYHHQRLCALQIWGLELGFLHPRPNRAC